VTHDEDVLDEVATRIWHFHDGKIEDFKGTYEEFQLTRNARRGREHSARSEEYCSRDFRADQLFTTSTDVNRLGNVIVRILSKPQIHCS